LQKLYKLAIYQDDLCYTRKKIAEHYFDFVLFSPKYIYFINIFHLKKGGLSGYSNNPKLVYYRKNKKELIANPLCDSFSLQQFSQVHHLDKQQLLRLIIVSGRVLLNDFTISDQQNILSEKEVVSFIKQLESQDSSHSFNKEEMLRIYREVG
jgi:hypothetical protein